MGQFIDFAEILEEKIRQELVAELEKTQAENTNHAKIQSEEWHFESQLHYQLFESLTLSRETSTSPKGARSSQQTPYARYRPKPKPRPSHKLNPIQRQALERLQTYAHELTDSYTKKQLQTAFRMAAKKTHPDFGHSAKLFIEIKMAYAELLTVFTVKDGSAHA